MACGCFAVCGSALDYQGNKKKVKIYVKEQSLRGCSIFVL